MSYIKMAILLPEVNGQQPRVVEGKLEFDFLTGRNDWDINAMSIEIAKAFREVAYNALVEVKPKTEDQQS